VVIRSVSSEFDSEWGSPRQRFLFQTHIRVQVHLSCFHRFVPEPEGNDGAVNAMLQKVHGCGMSKDMRRNFFGFEGGASRWGNVGLFSDETLDRIPAKSPAADAGKDWLFGLTVPFS